MQQQRLNPNAPVFTPRSKLAHPLYPAQPSSGRPAHIACPALNPSAFPFFPKSQRHLTLVSLNCRSVVNKLSELCVIAECAKPDIICLTETWLCPSNPLSLSGYICIRRDRPPEDNRSAHCSRGYGGVAVLVRSDSFPYVSPRADLQRPGCESVWLELGSPSTQSQNPILLCCMYRPPSQSTMQLSYFCDMFVEALQSVRLDSYDLLVTGDFNAHNSSWCPTDSTSKAGDLLSTVFAALGLH